MKPELRLDVGGVGIRVWNEASYTRNSRDNTLSFDNEILLNDVEGYDYSQHGVEVNTPDGKSGTCILICGGGSTTVHEHSAIANEHSLIVAVGDHICCLRLPELTMDWKAKADWVTCFGLHLSPRHQCYISHGECEVSSFSYSGEKNWETSGKDIFTGDFTVFDDFIVAEDFNGEKYKIDIRTGLTTLPQ